MSRSTGADGGAVRSQPATRRRVAAGLVGLAMVAVSFGVSVLPAAAASPPGTPTPFAVVGYTGQVRCYFVPPTSDGGSPITKYTISRTIQCICIQIPVVHAVTSTATFIDKSVVAGKTYSYKVTATNASGTSAASAASTVTVPTSFSDYKKFTNGVSFVNRQYQDFLGRAPTSIELSHAVNQLLAGVTAAQFIDTLAADPARNAEAQVTRLYFAYFKRQPDHGGLGYWTTQIKAHTKTINDVSNSFAGSSEFTTTYGSLSNLDFVTLVYHNVLDRDPDTAGLSFWSGQLDQHLVNRGRVMTQFSESNEFKTDSRGLVLAADTWDTMIHTSIPAARLSLYGPQIQDGGDAGSLATLLLTFGSYS